MIEKGWIGIVFCLLFYSCEEPRNMQAEIEMALELKTENYKRTEIARCNEDVHFAAEQYVDSLISIWVADQLIDTIKIPTKPIRPSSPPHILGTIDTFSTNVK